MNGFCYFESYDYFRLCRCWEEIVHFEFGGLEFSVENGCEWLRRIVNDCIYLCDEIGLVES